MHKVAVVFGGAGFIGCHLLRRLTASDQYERVYSVDIAEPRFLVPHVEYLKFDVRQPIPIRLCGSGSFELFNLAAVHTTPGHEDWEYYWTNVHGATNICKFANDVGAEYILFTSTMMVYGPSEAPKDEDSVLDPVNAYGRSKILAEGIHRLWQSEFPGKRRLTIVRPGVVYGLAERGNFTRLSRALKQRRFLYPGRTDTIKACGYINDLISSMIEMRERNEGVFLYNFSHPQRYTSKDICSAFAKAGGYHEPKFVAPYWFLGFVAFGFEVLATLGVKTDINRARVRKLYASTNMVPKRLQEANFKYAYDLLSGLTAWRRESSVNDFD